MQAHSFSIKDLLSSLNNAYINYRAQLVAAYLLKRPEAPALLSKGKIAFLPARDIPCSDKELSENLYMATEGIPEIVSLGWLIEALSYDEFADICVRGLLDSTARTVILDCYEAINEYAQHNGLARNSLFEMNWYLYLYFVRNALTHNYRWDFKRNKDKLPLTWNGKEISLSLQGKKVHTDHFNFHDVLLLVREMKAWVKQLQQTS